MSFTKIYTRMSEENKDSLIQLFREAGTIVDPFTVDLDAKGRKALPKMGMKTIGFTSSAMTIATNQPHLVPNYQDIKVQLANLEFARQLQEVLEVVEPVYEKIRDTWMTVGAEAYLAARVFYDSVKTASKQGVPGTDVIVKELGSIFKRSRSKAKTGEKTGENKTDDSKIEDNKS
jgi:hypothetical protein